MRSAISRRSCAACSRRASSQSGAPDTLCRGGEYSFAAVSSSRRPSSDDRCCGPHGGGRDLRRCRRPEEPLMHVSQLEWLVTGGVTIAVLLFNVLVMARRPREPTMRECAIALSIYVGLALAFGAWVWNFHGGRYGLEFYAGWLTEYSLSVDNLFIFIVIMASFMVP